MKHLPLLHYIKQHQVILPHFFPFTWYQHYNRPNYLYVIFLLHPALRTYTIPRPNNRTKHPSSSNCTLHSRAIFLFYLNDRNVSASIVPTKSIPTAGPRIPTYEQINHLLLLLCYARLGLSAYTSLHSECSCWCNLIIRYSLIHAFQVSTLCVVLSPGPLSSRISLMFDSLHSSYY